MLGGDPFPQWLRYICGVIAFLALLVDVPSNWSVLSIYMRQWPKQGEWTFSTRLERLCLDLMIWQGRAALQIARVLNWIAPPGKPHIKNAVTGR